MTRHHPRTLGAFLLQQFRRGKGGVWVRRKHGGSFWAAKNWGTLAFLLSLVTVALVPSMWGVSAALAGTALFLAMIFYLDLSRGKSPITTFVTFPLIALGYVYGFAGSVAGAVEGRSRTGVGGST